MPRTRTISGRLVQFERPNWQPLIDLIGLELVRWFMWMNELELTGGTRAHAYKHVATRRYLHVAEDGRLFAYVRGRYREIDLEEALDEVFFMWEDTMPEPDLTAVVALARLKAGAASQETS